MAQSPDFFLESDTNAEELANITAVLFNPALRIGYPIIAVICAALAAVALFFHFWFYAFLALLFSAFTVYIRVFLPKRLAQRQIGQYQESCGTNIIHQQLIFWPQGLVVVNCTTHAQFNLHYSTIHKIVKRKGYLILYTGANQVVTIKPTTLEKNPSLLPYLLQKCPDARRQGC